MADLTVNDLPLIRAVVALFRESAIVMPPSFTRDDLVALLQLAEQRQALVAQPIAPTQGRTFQLRDNGNSFGSLVHDSSRDKWFWQPPQS